MPLIKNTSKKEGYEMCFRYLSLSGSMITENDKRHLIDM